MMNIVH